MPERTWTNDQPRSRGTHSALRGTVISRITRWGSKVRNAFMGSEDGGALLRKLVGRVTRWKRKPPDGVRRVITPFPTASRFSTYQWCPAAGSVAAKSAQKKMLQQVPCALPKRH